MPWQMIFQALLHGFEEGGADDFKLGLDSLMWISKKKFERLFGEVFLDVLTSDNRPRIHELSPNIYSIDCATHQTLVRCPTLRGGLGTHADRLYSIRHHVLL